MVPKTNIWNRMGHWLRRSPRTEGFDGGEAAYLPPGPESEVVTGMTIGELHEPPVETAASEEPITPTRFRLSRSTANLERLEEEYKRIVKLIDDIQAHLSSQERRTESMVSSLDRLAMSLTELPEVSRGQLETLTRIQESLASQTGSMKRLEGELGQLPALADAQREALVSVDRRLESARQTDERTADTMDAFRGAVTRLSETSETSAKKLEEWHGEATTREHRVAHILEEQTKRLTIFALAAIGLAIVGLVVALIALYR